MAVRLQIRKGTESSLPLTAPNLCVSFKDHLSISAAIVCQNTQGCFLKQIFGIVVLIKMGNLKRKRSFLVMKNRDALCQKISTPAVARQSLPGSSANCNLGTQSFSPSLPPLPPILFAVLVFKSFVSLTIPPSSCICNPCSFVFVSPRPVLYL